VDNPKTDMTHCEWCSWDLYKKDAVDGMHADCVWRSNRRATLREHLIPVLIELGVTAPDRNNLLTDVCLRIERGFNEIAVELVKQQEKKA